MDMYLGLLSEIDPNIIIYGLLFVIFSVIIQFALGKALKDRSSASIIAICVSLLSVYGLSKANFDIVNIFYGIGINNGILYTVIPVIAILGVVYLFWKVKVRVIMLALGAILIIGSRFVYEKTYVLITGIILFVIGIFFMIKAKTKGKVLKIKQVK